MKRIFAIAFIIIGILSIILAFCAYGCDVGYPERNKSYGGDAYTGIQNAAAETANNVHYLTEAVVFGVGSILLVAGFSLAATGMYLYANSKEDTDDTPNQNTYTPNIAPTQPKPNFSAASFSPDSYVPTPKGPAPTADTWVCKNCGTSNKKEYGQCKKCGQYRS